MGNLVIACATKYDFDPLGNVKAEIAKKTLAVGKNLGYDFVIVDGGSPERLLVEFRELGADVYNQSSSGMGNGKREVIRKAFEKGCGIIVLTELEKLGLIDDLAGLVQFMKDVNAGLVIPKRMNLDSYPLEQQLVEKFGNLFWKRVTGRDDDVWFGARVFRREYARYFLDYQSRTEDLWDSIFCPLMDMIHDGVKIESFVVNYVHPSEQSRLEEDDLVTLEKRVRQIINLTIPLQEYWDLRMKK